MTDAMTDATTDATDPLLDEEWVAAPRKRSRLRTTLAVVLAAGLCFLGGALVQKHFGATTTTGSDAAAAGPTRLQLPAGMPEGFADGGAPLTQGSEGPDETDETGAVIGEVVEVRGDVWIVEDLGGERHRVQVGDDTDVVRETDVDAGDVEVGDPVDISGTTTDGGLRATEVTLR